MEAVAACAAAVVAASAAVTLNLTFPVTPAGAARDGAAELSSIRCCCWWWWWWL
jgi:hypothetical protein